MKKLLKKILAANDLKISRTTKQGFPDFDETFWPCYEKAAKFTMTSKERMYAFYQATRFVASNNIRGAIAECGVWKGGSMMLCALTLKQLQNERDLYLYDTYEGMSNPTEKDVTYYNESAFENWEKKKVSNEQLFCYSNLDEVKSNVFSTGYNKDKFHFIKGKVEDTIPATIPESIAILRLDTDWYESTYHELKHLYPLLVTGGVLIIDDYGYWKGSREATNTYFGEIGFKPLLQRIDQSGRIMIKP